MNRRRFLRAVTSGTVLAGSAASAGCLSSGDPSTEQAAEPLEPPATADVELPVPRGELTQALPRDYIPAITDPVFGEDWGDIDTIVYDGDVPATPTLPAEAPVLGVTHDGKSRAYPLRILNWHEIVNDEFGGPIAVTYCVLCGSGVVVERVVDGDPTIFGVSGKLWKSDLVMYDEATDSLWSQLLATAIRGEKTGTQLRILPSTLTTWGEWQETHPRTQVLLPPPASSTVAGPDETFDYFEPRYDYGDESQLVGRDSYDGGLHAKTMVVGVRNGETARAYPFHIVETEGVVEDSVAGLPVVVTVGPDGVLAAYDRRVDGETLSVEAGDDRHLLGGGSRWERTTGRAVDGPHEGRRLAPANDHPPMFWLGWRNFNPGTGVYGVERDASQ